MPKIESYVILDLETTGLPYKERNKTKITELCFLALSRKVLEVATVHKLPPISKLSYCFDPQKSIHPDVTRMTGFSNQLLKNSPIFKDKVKSLQAFLEELPEPVCLVAHNGNRFDFKILQTECEHANIRLPKQLLCVDSLTGFRKLLQGTNISHYTLNESQRSKYSLSTDAELWPDLNVSKEEWQEIDELSLSGSSKSDGSILTDDEDPSNPREIDIICNNLTNLTVTTSTPKKSNPKECFALGDVYKRLFNNEAIGAHQAEADCVILLQCMIAIKDSFLLWADENCKELREISPLKRVM